MEGSRLSTESPPIVHQAFSTLLRHPSNYGRTLALAMLARAGASLDWFGELRPPIRTGVVMTRPLELLP